jgi:hypothetical protein
VRYFPSIPSFFRTFTRIGTEFCQGFFCIYLDETLSFILSVCYSMLIDLLMLNHSCIHGKKPSWSLKCVVEFSLQVSYWEFLHLCSSRKLVCNFLSLPCPYPVLVILTFIEWDQYCSLLSAYGLVWGALMLILL